MSYAHKLNFLATAKHHFPNGVDESHNSGVSFTVVLKVGTIGDGTELRLIMQQALKLQKDTTFYLISFEGIDVIPPSAASAVVNAIAEIASEFKTPFYMSEVSRHVHDALHQAALTHEEQLTFWAERAGGKLELIGNAPNRFVDLLEKLKQGASSASELTKQPTNKREINKMSVYLQEMVNLGLVGRIKVNAKDRENHKRGWTYIYFRPDDHGFLNRQSSVAPTAS